MAEVEGECVAPFGGIEGANDAMLPVELGPPLQPVHHRPKTRQPVCS